MGKTKIQVVDEVEYGLFLWEMPGGKLVCDEEGNFLNIPGKKSDMSKVKIIEQEAMALGLEGGRPVFMSGHRRVTDEEYEYQKQRLEWGLTPDELDYGAARDELMNKKKGLIY